MTNRIVKVTLRGDVGNFPAQMRVASASVAATAKSMTAGTKEAQLYRQNLTALGNTAAKIGLVAAAGVALAVKRYADFDEALSAVAATGEDARQNLDALREGALEAGARTQYSATEAAGAIENLAKAGLSAQQILGGGLNGALDLAAAGGLDVAQAAEIAAISMKQFGLDGSQASHVADLLAAGAGKAVGDVSDLGAALAQSGLVANQTGLTIEETTAALSAMADAGLVGSDAGTSLKATLQRLTPQSAEAEAAMAELGISAYDANGAFVGLEALAGNLQNALADLTPEQRNSALATIFGSDAVRAATVLYEQGADGIRDYITAVDDQGYAAETAAVRMDNLKGDVEQLGGALETAFIGSAEDANGVLREMVQLVTGAVNVYNELPGPIKSGTVGVLGLTAALGGTVFAVTRTIDGVANLREQMTGVGAKFDQVNKKALAVRAGIGAVGIGLASVSGPAHEANEELGLLVDTASAAAIGFAVGGPWGAAIGGGIGLLSSLTGGSARAAENMNELTASLDQQTGAVTQNTARWIANELQVSGAAATLADLGISLQEATDAALGNRDAMREVAAKSKDANYEQAVALATVAAYAEALQMGAETTRNSAEVSSSAADAYGDVTAAADGLTDSTQQLTETQLEAQDAARAQAESYVDIGNAASEADGSLGAFRQTLLDQAEALNNLRDNAIEAGKRGVDEGLIQELREAGPEGAAILAKLAEASDKEIGKTNNAFRDAKGAVGNYTDALDGIPDDVSTDVSVNGVPAAQQAVANLRATLNSLSGKNFVANVFANVFGPGAATGGAIQFRASGGSVVGPGTGTSDSIPAVGPGGQPFRLSNGEHVWTAAEVDAVGGQAAMYRMRAAVRAQKFAAAYAGGGGVGPVSGRDSSPFAFSLVGAQVAIDPKTNIATFVQGEIKAAIGSEKRYDAAGRRGGQRQ